MKSLVALLVGFSLLILSVTAYSKPPSYLKAVKGLVWEDPENQESYPHCTVFSINADKHYFLTAAHCIDDDNVDIATIENHIISVIKISQEKDLAILFSNVVSSDLQLSPKSPEMGDNIHSVGFMSGYTFPLTFYGKVANPLANPFNRPFLIVGMTGGGGMSGGPFLNDDDRVVSVMEAGFGGGFGTSVHEVSGGVPYEVVKEFTNGFWR